MYYKKNKFLFLYIAVTVLLMLGCLFMAKRAQSVQTFSGNYVFSEQVAERTKVYEKIPLGLGVYEIVLSYRTDRDYSAICVAEGDVKHHRLFFTNGEHCYAGLNHTKFYLWVLEPTENFQLFVDYSGDGFLETDDLIIRNTGKLWTILMVGVLFVAVAGWGCICLCRFVKRTGWKNLWRSRALGVAVCVGLITMIASISQMGDYLIGGADLTYHLQRIEGVKDSILSGQFPVRIEPEWLYGHGYANGVLYCNLLLYFPALLRIAGFPVNLAYNLFGIGLNLITVWIAYDCFSRIFRDARIGLMCSALYTLSAIRLFKFIAVCAVGEGSAITFLPLIFYGMYCVFLADEKEECFQSAWISLAVGYAGVIQTHVLTSEITVFLTALVCLIGIRKISRRSVFLTLAKGALGALGLSMWYLVPFLDYFFTQNLHIRHVSGRTIQERGLYFSQLFVDRWDTKMMERFAQKGMTDVEGVGIGPLCMCALLVFLILWLCGMFRKPKQEGEEAAIFFTAKISAGFSVLLLLITLRIFPWDRIQGLGSIPAALISSLQVPYRFLGWAMVFLIMVFGTCLWRFRKYRLTYWCGALLVLLSIWTGAIGTIADITKEDGRLRLYNEAGMGFGYISGAEYLVQGTEEALLTFYGPRTGENVFLADYSKRYLQVNMFCENEGSAESYVDLPLLLYKGYRAKTSAGESLEITDGFNHLVRVVLPAGFRGDVEVKFVSPFYWRISEGITLLTVIGLTGVLFKRKREEKFRTIAR